ncbi:hypothetical protein ACFWV1_13185 [Streptomyces sp. NPDC058700]|uniref:hypothetical protein n=1 Tax=unclassified Streptomyces TaxID=2593676 RepID=UPI00365DFD18
MTTRHKQLERTYTVKEAAWFLKLADEEKPTGGMRFLRNGVNREHDPFPHVRINGRLKFTESQLIEIHERHINAPNPRTGRPRMKRRVIKRAPSAAQALAA